MRKGAVSRKTSETAIDVSVDLDGSGKSDIATGVGFFDHMLDQLARHSLIDMTVRAKGDLHIDDHHTVEDVGIALGQALRQALGDKRGITRYADVPAADGRDADPRRASTSPAGRSWFPDDVPDRQDRRPSTPSWCASSSRPSRSTPAITLHIETLYGAEQPSYRRNLLQGRSARAARGACNRPAAGRRGAIDQGRARAAERPPWASMS